MKIYKRDTVDRIRVKLAHRWLLTVSEKMYVRRHPEVAWPEKKNS